MKIMIGVDDSPHSKAAVEYVKKMKWSERTSVIVLSAVQPVATVYAEAWVPAAEYEALNQDLVRRHQELGAIAERDLRAAGLTTEARAVMGDPRTVLIDLAERELVDLIVVGSHGRTGIAKLLMGSVASHVVTHAPCSVMVVKMRGGNGS